MPPCQEDLQHAQEVMARFDFSRFGDKFENKELPRYLQYEIMRDIYRKSFINEDWQEEYVRVDSMFFIRLNFIIGYEYYHAGNLDKAKSYFEEALFQLNRHHENPSSYESLQIHHLFLGSIQYFLGNTDEAVREYERGIKHVGIIDDVDMRNYEVYQLNCFYENTAKICGSFFEQPFLFLTRVRNIFFMRAFNITFDAFLIALLFWLVLSCFWIFAAKAETYLNKSINIYLIRMGKFLITLAAVCLLTNSLAIHNSLRSLILISGSWFLASFISLKFIKSRHPKTQTHRLLISIHSRLICLASITLPWAMFFFVKDNYLQELDRLFRMTDNYWGDKADWIGFTFNSLIFLLLLAVGVYAIHFLLSFFVKKEKPGFIYSLVGIILSAPLFYLVFPYLMAAKPYQYKDYNYLFTCTTWYVSFLGLEYFIARPIALQLPEFERLNIAHSSMFWHFIRILFLVYPALLSIDKNKVDFSKTLTYLPFWPVVTGLVFVLHFSMAKIFEQYRNKIDYSILISILSMAIMYIAMVAVGISDIPQEEFPIYYILWGIIWLCLVLQYKPKRPNPLRQFRESPALFKYIYYNRYWSLVEFSFILMPILYGIIYSTWAGHERAYMGF